MSQVTITDTSNALVIQTSKEVEGFTLTLSCPALYYFDNKSGYLATSVSVGIYYKKADDPGTSWTVLDSNFVISSAATRSEVLTVVGTVEVLELAKYSILLKRNTASHAGAFNYADEVYLKEINEIIYSSLSYNHTALLGLKIRATDQLSGNVPTVTCLVKGTKVAVPSNMAGVVRYDESGNYNKTAVDAAYAAGWTDGKLTWCESTIPTLGELEHTGTKYWTDNPVWCLYDLLTNRRYGLADYYRISDNKIGIMRANFYLMAKYCDEAISYTDENGIQKWRPRFALNIVLDQAKGAADWVSTIAAIMRANLFYTEGIFWLDIDRKQPISALFNMSNISDYSQSGTPFRGIPNTYEVQWINPKANYEVDSFRLESDEMRKNQTVEERKKALLLLGVTNLDQAKSLGKFALLSGQHRKKIVTFKTGTHGLNVIPGSVIGIQHDVPQWGWGGTFKAVQFHGITNTATITLSQPFTYDVAVGNLKMLVTQDGKQPVFLNVVTVPEAGEEVTQLEVSMEYVDQGTTSPIHVMQPSVGDRYIIGGATNTVNTFRITSIKRDSDERCEITAVEYYDDLYSMCDDTSTLGVWNTTNYSLIANPQRVSVTNVEVFSKISQNSTGDFIVGAEVFFTAPQSTFWRGAELNYAKVGSSVFKTVPSISRCHFVIPEITDPGEYQFVVTSVYARGKQTIQDALADTVAHPWGEAGVYPYVPNNAFMEGVTGLTVQNRANDGTFNGKDCVFTWRRPCAIDIAGPGDAGTESAGAGTDTSNLWFKDYKVEIRNLDGTVRRTTRTVTETYTYTHEMNHADGNGTAVRDFVVAVTAYDRMGRESATITLEALNPAPAPLF